MPILAERDALEVIKDNYIDYSEYTIDQRTYCSMYDGMKAVQRRCLYSGYRDTPRTLTKLPNHIGAAMVYHPHGDSSIAGAIINMGSKYCSPFPLYDTKGNWGDRENPASAARYLECHLSDLAIDIFMPFVDYADMGTPEYMLEPLALPVLLPLVYLQGASGIGSGTPNPNVPAFNPLDLIKYYIEALDSNDFKVDSKFMVRPNVGNTLVASSKKQWLDMMRTGQGTIKYEPQIDISNGGNTIVITRVPDGKGFENLLKKLATEIAQDKIDVRDETTEDIRYVIEKVPRKSCDMSEVAKKAMSSLTASEAYKFIFSDKGIAKICGFNHLVQKNLEYTLKCCLRRLESEIDKLTKQAKVLEIIDCMKRDKLVIKISEMTKDQAVGLIVNKYKEDREYVEAALQKSIAYLTSEHDSELKDIHSRIDKLKSSKDDPRGYLKDMYKGLIPKVKAVLGKRVLTEFKK